MSVLLVIENETANHTLQFQYDNILLSIQLFFIGLFKNGELIMEYLYFISQCGAILFEFIYFIIAICEFLPILLFELNDFNNLFENGLPNHIKLSDGD